MSDRTAHNVAILCVEFALAAVHVVSRTLELIMLVAGAGVEATAGEILAEAVADRSASLMTVDVSAAMEIVIVIIRVIAKQGMIVIVRLIRVIGNEMAGARLTTREVETAMIEVMTGERDMKGVAMIAQVPVIEVWLIARGLDPDLLFVAVLSAVDMSARVVMNVPMTDSTTAHFDLNVAADELCALEESWHARQ